MATTQKHFQFLRKGGFTSLAKAKEALNTKFASNTYEGEPIIAYYKESELDEKTHVLFGIGGKDSGTSLFYNAETVDELLTQLHNTISGTTDDTIAGGLTLNALKNYVDTMSSAATTTVVSGDGISVTESANGTAKQFAIAANLQLSYSASPTSGQSSYIEITDPTTKHSFGKVNVSDIIGDGMLQDAKYDAATGKLTLTFKTADGKTKDVVVDLGALIDINDIAIKEDSKDYLAVELNAEGPESGSQAVFSAKVVSVSANTKGMADAKDVKAYVDAEVLKEKTAREEAISGLDATITSYDGTNINVKVTEEDGKVTAVNITDEKYATVSYTGHTGDIASAQTAAFSASDTAQIATGAHVQAAATYAKGLYDEALGYTDAKIENLAGDKTSDDAAAVTVQVKTENGEVSDVIVSNVSAGVATGGAGTTDDPYYLSASTATGALVGSDVATVKTYVDNMVADAKGDLSVEATGDTYVDAHVDAANNKKVVVSAQTANVSVTAGTAGVYDAEGAQTTAPTHGTISGTSGKLLDSADAMTSTKTYVDGEIAIEAARSDANTLASIKALDVTEITKAGEYIVAVSETDGKISATTKKIGTDEVSAATVTATDTTIGLTGTTAKAQLEELATAIKTDENNELSYRIVSASPSSTTVKEEFKLQQKAATATTWDDVSSSENIKIYKDQSVKSITYETRSGSTKGSFIKYVYIDSEGNEQTTWIDLSEVVVEAECGSGITMVDHKFVGQVDSTGEFLSVGANGFKVSGVSDAISGAINTLDATVSAETTYSSIQIDEVDGKLTGVTITNTIGVVSASTAGYAEAVETKAYVDKMVSDKNVSATGDSYVAASAADNKVTVATNVSALTVTTTAGSDSTIAGTANSLVDGSDIAAKVTSFVNARIDEQIAKLAKAETTVSGTNVSFKYSETSGITTIADLTVDYTTVTASTGGTTSAQTNSLTVTDDSKIATGANIKTVGDYAKSLSIEDRAYTDAVVATLDAEVTDTNTVAADGDNLTVKVTEVDGKLTGVEASISVWDCGCWE